MKDKQRKKISQVKYLGKQADFVIENLATLLSAGIDVAGSIEAVISGVKSKRAKNILQKILNDLDEGLPLWKSFLKEGLLAEGYISLVKIGEESGKLPENLMIIAKQQQKNRSFKSKIKAALSYPIIVFTLTVVVGIGVSWFVLPKLAKVFTDLKIKLPLISKILISFGIFIEKYGIYIIPLFIVAIIGFSILVFGNSKARKIGLAIAFRVPGLKRLMIDIEVSRMGYILSSLLESGMTAPEALNLLFTATPLGSYKKYYGQLIEKVDEGVSFEKAFEIVKAERKIIPPNVQQMIIAGERSGKLPEMLQKISDIYEEKADDATKNLASILEPILLVIVWLGVLVVALAVILPIYSLLSGLS